MDIVDVGVEVSWGGPAKGLGVTSRAGGRDEAEAGEGDRDVGVGEE